MEKYLWHVLRVIFLCVVLVMNMKGAKETSVVPNVTLATNVIKVHVVFFFFSILL